MLGRILSGGRDLLRSDALVLQDGDGRVAQAVIRLDRGVDAWVGGVLLLEDSLSRGIIPAGCNLLRHECHAVVRLARGQRGCLIAPDRLVVTLGEGDRVRVRVLAAVQLEDLRARDAPVRDTFLEAVADQLADLDIVEAHVIDIGAGEGGAVITDGLHALALGELLDLPTDVTVQRVEDQHFRAGGDVGGGEVELLRRVAPSVLDLVLVRLIAGRVEGFLQIWRIEVDIARR